MFKILLWYSLLLKIIKLYYKIVNVTLLSNLNKLIIKLLLNHPSIKVLIINSQSLLVYLKS